MNKASTYLRVTLPALLLLACSSPPAAPVDETEINVDETAKLPVKVRAGDIVKVNLDVRMSSGASWQLVTEPSAHLESLGSKVVPSPDQNNPPGMVGQKEVQVFRFKAVSEGEVSLEFRKARPWEKQGPEKTFSVRFEVAAK